MLTLFKKNLLSVLCFCSIITCADKINQESALSTLPHELKLVFLHTIAYCDKNSIIGEDYLVTAIMVSDRDIVNFDSFWNGRIKESEYERSYGRHVVVRFDSISTDKESFCILLPLPLNEKSCAVKKINLHCDVAEKIPMVVSKDIEKPWRPILFAINKAINVIKNNDMDVRRIAAIILLYDQEMYDSEYLYGGEPLFDVFSIKGTPWLIECSLFSSFSYYNPGVRSGNDYLLVEPQAYNFIKMLRIR